MVPIKTSRDSPRSVGLRLRGLGTTLIRAAWCLGVGLSVGLFIASVPTYFAYLHKLASGVVVDLTSGQLTPSGVRALQAVGISVDVYAIYHLVLNTLFVLGFFLVGGVLFWRKATDRMALFAAFVLILFPIGFIFQITTLPSAWLFLAHAIAFLSGMGICLFFYTFPNGRFAPHWTPWLLIAWAMQESINDFLAFSVLYYVQSVLLFMLVISLFVAQIYRYRRVSTSLERQQTRWVVFGFTVALLGFLAVIMPGTFFPSAFQPGTIAYFIGDTAISFFLLLIPLSIGIAILRYRLWDIDLIINRTLVYGTLTASVVALYILVVGYLGALFSTGGNLAISLVATGLVAVLFQPLRGWLQRGVNRLMYGQRDEPYAVVARLGRRLEDVLEPDAVLPTIAETVAHALKLPYTAIHVRQNGTSAIAAAYGTPRGDLTHLPLIYQSEPIGDLVLAPRAPGETFSPADRILLGDLARQAGVAAHAVRLTADLRRLAADLQASRLQIITTREEERRRLRRDLHDGLGSALTSVTFQLDAATNLLDRDPQAVKDLLRDVKTQTQASIADIRRLIYDLRPPILDEWGLVAAIREQVNQYHLHQVQVTVAAPESLPPLPAALEVAAYRIALEALANVVRHAQATTCTIRLNLSDEDLTITVQDNGQGIPPDLHAGVGINAMRERAAELGGTLRVERFAGWGGTLVVASLPCVKGG